MSALIRLPLLGAIAVLLLNQCWLAILGQDRRVNLALVAFNASIGLLVLARLLQHLTEHPGVAELGARLLIMSGLLLVPFGIIVARALARLSWTRGAYLTVVLTALPCVTPWLGSLIITDVTANVDALGASYYASSLSPVAVLLIPYGVVAFVVIGSTLRRGTRIEAELRHGLGLIAVFIVLGFAHDVLLTRGSIHSILIVDFVAAGQAVVYGYALARRAARLDVMRILFDAVPDSVLVMREGRFLFANPTGEAYLGYSAKELRGRPLLDLIPEENRQNAAEWLKAMEASSERAPPVEKTFIRKDGKRVTGEIAGLPVELGGRMATVAIVRDVTDRKEMQAQLLQADRLSSVGTLAAGVAHEINNPLTYVFGHLDLIYEWLGKTDMPPAALEELRGSLDRIEEGLDRVRTIVRDLKTFSRSEEQQIGAVSLSLVIEQAVGLVRHQFKYRARLVLDLSDIPPVKGSEARLGQVFLNLLLNAAQAIPEGAPDEMEIRVVTYLDAPERVVAEIRDTGVGIEPRDLERVFDPFFTTKAAAGTGLGLPISHGIVTALGGEITVTSEPGKGTCFRVTLPVAEEKPTMAPTARRRRASTQAPAMRILVIDDEPDVRTTVKHMLSGHVVTTACDGAEALVLCEELEFDLLLCDVMMVGMSGVEFYKQILARHADLAERTIFISGGALSESARAFLKGVSNPLVEKPFERRELRDLVKQIGPR